MAVEDKVECANPSLMPRVRCGRHKQLAIADFVALVVVELIILLVGPALA